MSEQDGILKQQNKAKQISKQRLPVDVMSSVCGRNFFKQS